MIRRVIVDKNGRDDKKMYLWQLVSPSVLMEKEDVKANRARAEVEEGGGRYDDPHVPGMSAVHKLCCWKT